jgi:hypothetical protein
MPAILDQTEIAAITSKSPASGLGCCQSSFSPGGDHLPLMLSHGGEDVDGKPVRLREIHRDEIDPALHQVGDEGDISGEAIQLGDYEGGPMEVTEPEGFLEPGSV